MKKRFLKTTQTVFDKCDKNSYNDSIVFIEDTGKIWTNGKTYPYSDGDGTKYLANDGTYKDLIIPDTLPNPVSLTLTVDHPTAGKSTYEYDGTTDPQVYIDLNNLSTPLVIDIAFESIFTPSLQITGSENQYSLTGDGHILTQGEWEEILTKLNSIDFCSTDEINNLF